MARIPQGAVTVGLASDFAQPVREKLQIGQAIVDLAGASIELNSRLAEAARADEFTQMSSSLEGSLADLQLSIQQDPGLNTVALAEQAYKAGAEQIHSDLGRSTSRVVNTEIDKQFLKSTLRGNIAVKKAAYGRQADASVAGLDTAEEELERAYAVATDDEKRAEIRAQYAQSVNLNSYISEQVKGDRIRDFATNTDTARVQRLIDTGQFEAAQDLLSSDQLVGIDPNKNLALQRSLEIGRKRAETDLKLDLKKVEDTKIHSLLRRFNDENDPDGIPSVPEILDMNLPRIVSEHFIGLAEKHATGADINALNTNVYTYLYKRVHDDTRADHITDPNELLPWLGNGLPVAQQEILRKDIEQLAAPQIKAQAKADDALWNDFLKVGEGLIDRSSFMGKDGVGGDKYFQFQQAATVLRDEGLKKGISLNELVSKASPNYIGLIIPGYMRTDAEVGADMLERSLGLTTIEVAPPLAVPTREGNESIDSWASKRVGQ
jgi:hypothetical protein